jgi:hypothetical protein
MESPRDGYHPARTMEVRQRGLHYILGGAFMVIIGVIAAAALGVYDTFLAAPLWFTGALFIAYGVWLRR